MKLLLSISLILGLFTTTPTQTKLFVNLFDRPETVEIKATINTSKCNNKAYVPLEIPENAVGIYYAIKTVNKAEYQRPYTSLAKEVEAVAHKAAPTELADYMMADNGRNTFNFYIIPGKEFVKSFSDCDYFEYVEKYTRTKSKIGYLDVTRWKNKPLYLGFENPKDLQHLRLTVEVVAVLAE